MFLKGGALVPLEEPPTSGRMVARQMAAGLMLPVRQDPAVAQAREPLRGEAPYTQTLEERFVARLDRTDQAWETLPYLAGWREQRLRVVDFPHPHPG
jgi:hypothetical protein